MSHYAVLVIGDNPEELLAPFDENIRLEPYLEGEVSEEDKASMVRYYKEAKEDFPKNLPSLEEEFEYAVKHYGEAWNGDSYKFQDGKWVEISTYNPNSKYDYYRLGGRWRGHLNLKEGLIAKELPEVVVESPTWDSEYETEPNQCDQAPIKYVDKDKLLEFPFFAILTSQGEWIGKGDMGWWGIALNVIDDWDKIYRDTLTKLLEEEDEDTLISVFDLHI